MDQLNELPANLPIPADDGAAQHLTGLKLPQLSLFSTDQSWVDLSRLEGLFVLFIFPMTGRPDVPLPAGWDAIPGARGCTPQACGFRDHFAELQQFNVSVYGISSQSTEDQSEAVQRLHLPYSLLSDSAFQLSETLHLPTFRVEDRTLLKRITLICHEGRIIRTFYPVFPPDKHAEMIVNILKSETNAARL